MAVHSFCQIAVRALEICEHRRFLLRNLRPKYARFQAPRRVARELAQQPRTSMDRWAVALLVSTIMFDVKTVFASTSPLANPMQHVAGRVALRTGEPLARTVISAAPNRHRP